MTNVVPCIVLLTDGCPTDDWEKPLAELQNNRHFMNALKIAFAIGNDANKDVLAKICGTSDSVINIEDPRRIKQNIQFATALVAKFGVKARDLNNNIVLKSTIIKQIRAFCEDKPIMDISDLVQPINKIFSAKGGESKEHLFALYLAVQLGEMSISLLHRKMRFGFSRAAALCDWMEREGYIVDSGIGKRKKVTLTEEKFMELYGDEFSVEEYEDKFGLL